MQSGPSGYGSGVELTLCLGGDVMTGRGVDQLLPSPGDPRLAEAYVDDARTYVELAERVNGPIPRPVPLDWPWGDALPVLRAADACVVNLETSITARGAPAPGKAVHYRMHPENTGCLVAAGVDVCSLANNHLLDFGPEGLLDTLDQLAGAGIAGAGAGRTAVEAGRPVTVPLPGDRRLVVTACGTESSGIPPYWRATSRRPGVQVLTDLTAGTADGLAARCREHTRPGDVAVVSVHWGSNWGYAVPDEHVRFAHRLVDAGVDVVHGHSSHHPRPLEVYRGKAVLYGCGDLVDDYEGITGHVHYRDELRLLYLVTVDSTGGTLLGLRMVPLRARRMRLERAGAAEVQWLRDVLSRISDCEVGIDGDGFLAVDLAGGEGVRPPRSG